MSSELSSQDLNRGISVPSYVKNLEPYDYSDINKAAKPPFIKVINALAGSPYKPPFVDMDIIVAPQMKKIGDKDNAFTFVPFLFFTHYQCVNPIETRGNLSMIREQSFDDNSELAKKCKRFLQDIPCPEYPKKSLKFNQVLDFFVILEDIEELKAFPTWLIFVRGSFKIGQTLLGMIQARGAPPYCCRFRAHSKALLGKGSGSYYHLNVLDDPRPWVNEENAIKYQELSKTFKQLILDRKIDLTDSAEEANGDNPAEENKF